MKNELPKNIYVLNLNGLWNNNRVTEFVIDDIYATVKYADKKVRIGVPSRWHLKKNTGKCNSIERPLVYCFTYYTTKHQVENYNKKFESVMADLNSIDLSEIDHIPDNAEDCCKLAILENICTKIGEIFKKHKIENVYTENIYAPSKVTKNYSSYTPEEIDKAFIKLS